MGPNRWRLGLHAILCGCLVAAASGQARIGELKKKLQSKESADRLLAANELSKLGKGAAPAAGDLAAALADGVPEVRNAAADALGAIGKAALPTLKQALADNDLRLGALRAAGHLGADAVDLLPLITKCWRVAGMSQATNKCVESIGEPAVPHLIELLKDNQLGVHACGVLQQLGPRAKAAVPALIALLGKPGVGGSMGAAEALGPIGEPSAVPALTAAVEAAIPKLDSRVGNIGFKAVRSLSQLGKPAATAIPTLLKALASERRDSEFVRLQTEVLDALERLAIATPEVLAGLRAFLAVETGENKARAQRLLKKLGG